MDIIRNDKLIKRNGLIGKVGMISGLAILVAGLVVSYQDATKINLSMFSLLVGFVVSQIGIYYMNRWGRKPRPDEMLDKVLEGLDKRYSIYHYSSPVSHLLLGPGGLWILLPYYQRGNITFSKGRWRQSGGGLFYQYLRIFAQEGLGRPDLEVSSENRELTAHLKKHLPDQELPPIRTALVFFNPRVNLIVAEGETPPAEMLMMSEIRTAVRKNSKTALLTPERIKQIRDILTQE